MSENKQWLSACVGVTFLGVAFACGLTAFASKSFSTLPVSCSGKVLESTTAHSSGTMEKTAAHKPYKQMTCLQQKPMLEKLTIPQGELYFTRLTPDRGYELMLGVNDALATVESSVWQKFPSQSRHPLFVINAGFFDPKNSKTTSWLTHDGNEAGNPKENAQMMDNPALANYIPKILNRSEFRVYGCKTPDGHTETTSFDITLHNTPVPERCKIREAAGSGPVLLPERTDMAEGFIDNDSSGRRVRDPLGVDSKNARSALGLDANGRVLLVMLAQTPTARGLSLGHLAVEMKKLGAVKALALDGGSSSSFRYEDQVVYGKLSAKGAAVKRPVKSVWMIVPKG